MAGLIRSVYRERQDRKYVGSLFDWRGRRVAGDPRVEIEVLDDEESTQVWWFRPKPFEDYHYVRMPVNAGAVIEVLRRVKTDVYPQVEAFRYVATLPPGVFYSGEGGVPNARVSFMVFAYRPEDLLRVSAT